MIRIFRRRSNGEAMFVLTDLDMAGFISYLINSLNYEELE
jgi:hypothetical protein